MSRPFGFPEAAASSPEPTMVAGSSSDTCRRAGSLARAHRALSSSRGAHQIPGNRFHPRQCLSQCARKHRPELQEPNSRFQLQSRCAFLPKGIPLSVNTANLAPTLTRTAPPLIGICVLPETQNGYITLVAIFTGCDTSGDNVRLHGDLQNRTTVRHYRLVYIGLRSR